MNPIRKVRKYNKSERENNLWAIGSREMGRGGVS